jgi:hypothetical protein
MELVDPIVTALSAVSDLVKANQELYQELGELGDTISLIEVRHEIASGWYQFNSAR